MKKRILSTLLCFVMVVGMLPTSAFAWDDDNYYECIFCGAHYYGDVDDSIYDESDYCCGPDGNQECWLEIHCHECGEYLDKSKAHDCCPLCDDCIEDRGSHCTECGDCYLSDEDQLCGECHRCDTCAAGICEDCGLCDDCAEDADSDNTHCIICGACASTTDWHDDTHHCQDCCVFCEQCEGIDTCLAESDTEFCDECGLCMDCCMENREAFGCDVFCVESSEFEDHFCEECGTCWCNTYQCGYCGLCAECCANNSTCSEGMCVEDSDYDDHFCPECDKCTHDVGDLCSECGLCEDCCQEKLEDVRVSGCSGCANFTCVEQDGFEEHMNEYHSDKGYTHQHRFAKSWSMDETNHWHACLSCEDGKDATGSENAGHTADSATGICTVCGYKNGETMYFITQPEDVHVQVSESHYYGSYYWANPGPTNYWNNRTSFRVKAFSSNGPLYYRWCQVKDGVATALEDNTTDKGKLYVSGATTPTLTISVSEDSCTSNYSYYCRITDEKGTVVTSSQAQMVASHRYSLAAYDKTTESGSIWLKTYYGGKEGWMNRAQTSTGHKWYCCGTGHDAENAATLNKKAKSHNWQLHGTAEGAYTKEALLDNNCITFNAYRCTDCSYVKYVEEHECYTLPKQYDASHEDAATKHQMVCMTAGCDKTGSALHKWEYQIVSWPSESKNGSVYRECYECKYYDADFTWTTVEVTKNTTTGETTVGTKTDLNWTTDNILVDVLYGTANCSLAAPGDTVVLTPEMNGERAFTGWEMRYFYDDSEYTVSLTVTKDTESGKWHCTIPEDFFVDNNVPGGGNLYFTGQYASGACDHEGCGTTLVGQKDAVCIYTGYSGDTVCAACGGLVESGTVTPAPDTEHTGTLVPVEGSVKVEATCTKDGHEVDTRCSACNHVVSGTKTERLKHERKTENKKDATCTEKGYSGDIVCKREGCGKTIANGHEIPATGHSWGEGVVSKQGKLTVVTYTCKTCGATTTQVRRGEVLKGDFINSVNLTMTGYALGKTAGDVKVKPDEDTAEKLTATLTGIYSARPFTKNDTENINAKLSNADKIKAEKTYYALVQLTANGDLKFNPEMSTKEVTLYNTRRAAELHIVEHSVSGEKFYFAVFQLQKLRGTYIVTMDGAGDGAFGAGSYKSKNTVTINAGTKDGYTFSGWTVSDGVTLEDATSANTSFKMPTKDVTVTANWTKNGSAPVVPDYGDYDDSEPSYTITVKDAANGEVSANRRTAEEGETVTVTVDPDKGYTLETLTVVDRNGKEVKLTDKGNGKYTFKMPASKVTVTATFMEDNSMLNFFVDVTADKYYYDAVLWAAENGITGGIDATHFAPNATCTRAQAVTFLWRAAGCPAPKSSEMPFTDVPSGSYCYDAVLWAVENGITRGTTDTTFSPNAECSRAQIVTFLWRSQKSPAIDAANPFTDVSAEAYYASAVLWAAANGITGGTTATTFDPNANCTRAQIVTFIYRCMK